MTYATKLESFFSPLNCISSYISPIWSPAKSQKRNQKGLLVVMGVPSRGHSCTLYLGRPSFHSTFSLLYTQLQQVGETGYPYLSGQRYTGRDVEGAIRMRTASQEKPAGGRIKEMCIQWHFSKFSAHSIFYFQ